MAKSIRFKNYICKLVKSSYMENGRIALLLMDEETGEPIATATTNIVDYTMSETTAEDYTFIKNWGENEGMLQSLIDQGIVEDTGIDWPTGFVRANLVKVLI